MDLKQLTYFVTVIKEGTISGAARKLNLSQPPLSTQMKRLEEEVGCVLFERGSRKIQLTEAGQLLYERAVTMLELSEVTKKELLDYRNGLTGALRLGVVSSVGCSLLPEWVSAFHSEFPAIRFELYEANTYQLLEQLRSNLIELAIVRTPFHGEEFACTTLRHEPMLAVGTEACFSDVRGSAGSNLPDSADTSGILLRDTISLQALSRLPLIIYRRWEAPLREAFAREGLSPSCFCMNDDARTSVYWADAGLGVGIVPASSRPLLRNPQTKVYEIGDSGLFTSISVVHNKNAYLSTIARRFLTHLVTIQPSPPPA